MEKSMVEKEKYHRDDCAERKNTANNLVSVIIPVFNVQDYLCECLDSVLGQTYCNLEIILINDGSTDASGKICDEYALKDKRIQVVHQSNSGQGHSRNIGMDLAHGKYLVFLDSDDYWDVNTIQILFDISERDSLQVLAFSAEPFWDGIARPANSTNYRHDVQNGVVQSGPVSMKCAIDHHEYFTAPVLRFYLLSYLKEHGFRFDEGYIHEDESFSFLAYLLADRVECIGDRLYKRRYRKGSSVMTKSLLKSAKGYADALNTLAHYYQEHELTEQQRELFRLYFNLLLEQINALYGRTRSGKKCSMDESREIAKYVKNILIKIRILNPQLPFSYKLSTYNLYAAYYVRKIRQHARRKQ